GKALEPGIRQPPGDGGGDDKSDQYQAYEFEGKDPYDGGGGSAKDFSDADLFGSPDQDERGKTKETQTGGRYSKPADKSDHGSGLFFGVVGFLEVFIQELELPVVVAGYRL